MPTTGLREPPGSGALLLGLDEAGRGSQLGPLVSGGFLVRASELPRLGDVGARDSKELTGAQRRRVYDALPQVGVRLSRILSPPLIDRFVDRGRLNDLEARAFASLIRRARPDRVFVDACDPNAKRFGATVLRYAQTDVAIEARHRADVELPIVGAASIVAKVERDGALETLRDRWGAEIGSGYPSDPRTQEFVRAHLADGRPVPTWIRASWAPTQRVILSRTTRTLDEFGP